VWFAPRATDWRGTIPQTPELQLGMPLPNGQEPQLPPVVVLEPPADVVPAVVPDVEPVPVVVPEVLALVVLAAVAPEVVPDVAAEVEAEVVVLVVVSVLLADDVGPPSGWVPET
jgi:hypothetical protein